jgi:methylmalonyl-CoA/ethylmalonyl-CoA epimerase
MDLKYSHVDIVVSDLEKAVSYYQKVFGCVPSRKQTWKRGDFHVDYVIMFKDATRFYFVQPYSGPLKKILEEKGEGTIYRLCFTSKDVKACFRELKESGVQPEDENGQPMSEDILTSPTGTPIIWLPKAFGDLSMEILEEKPMEARLAKLRSEAERD